MAIAASSKPPPQNVDFDEQKRLRAFTLKAPTYDAHVEKTEAGWVDIKGLRQQLCARAYGDVLEIAAGTGRNLEYFLHRHHAPVPGSTASTGESADTRSGPPPVTSLTLIDFAPAMLEVAHGRALSLGVHNLPPLTLRVADVHDLTTTLQPQGAGDGSHAAGLQLSVAPPASVPAGSIDTVVDTFGLCSLHDPVAALQQVAQVLKPGGQLLLLEHGRSSWGMVNWLLDRQAAAHELEWGCAWNRDPVSLVRAAGCYDLTSVRRRHLGTTYTIVARRK